MDSTFYEKPELDFLMHYGKGHLDGGHSGRYPWGSGDDPYQRSYDWYTEVNKMKKNGKTEKDICEFFGLSSTEYRAYYSIARNEHKQNLADEARRLRDEGLSLQKIAERMGYNNDSSVRALLNEKTAERRTEAQKNAERLKKRIDEVGMIDVGKGVERELGISAEKLDQAIAILEAEGYPLYGGRVAQVTNDNQGTILKILCPPGTEHKEIYEYDKINTAVDYRIDAVDVGDFSRQGFVYPASMDSKRIMIRYDEDGGSLKDGVVELRRNVPDLSLGDSNYAQVRILVDGDKYIKGMAVYGDDKDFPDGIDAIVNSHYSKNNPLEKNKALKAIKNDPENPFGSAIKENGGQSYYIDENGEKKLSLINKRSDQGDWGEWKDTLASQFLSKQPLSLIKKQLKIAEDDKQAEFDEICSLTNPTVKKVLLESFANDCDSAAKDLKAAAIPGQKFQVILPITSLSDKQIYAPNFNDGDTVALVRYPHAGIFEIPILTVNNKNREGRRVLGTHGDAVGINSEVAKQLSGADFDGDTVMVIPCNTGRNSKIQIKNKPYLNELKGFDPQAKYGAEEKKIGPDGKEHYYRNGKEFRVMGADTEKGIQMGMVTNLIADMTLKGASDEELARAVKHSMVVIDAPKHKLDWKASELDNGIAELKRTWQGYYDNDGNFHTGASTIVSRAKNPKAIPKRKGNPWINKETGEEEWERINPKTGEYETKYVHETYTDKNGKVHERTIDVPRMSLVKDAHELSSGHPKEEAYANYANKMKSLANAARKEMVNTPGLKYSASAAKTYSEEVSHLNSQLNVAKKNSPKERWAQLQANATVKARSKAYLEETGEKMSSNDRKKIGTKALNKARLEIGAQRTDIKISPREWEAIQAGAISDNNLREILTRTDIDTVRQYATPRTTKTMSTAKINRAISMRAAGRTNAEIAAALGVSPSTVTKYLNEKE